MNKFKPALFFVVLFLILLCNTFYVSYPDEFDNILGGKLILQGILPYSGFFSHHGSLSYFLSSIFVFLGGISFVHYRIITSVFFLGLFAGEAYILKRRLPKFDTKYFLGFLGLLGIGATYFWGQLFLADIVSGYFLILPYSLLLLKSYYQEKLENKDIWLISIFSALAVLNSTTYLYAGIIIGLVTLFYERKKFLRVIISFSIPYLIFLVYLLITKSLADFLFQAIYYNQHYYISNYPWAPGATFFNPFRYAVVIFSNFYGNFDTAITGILGANLHFPMTHFLAVVNLTFWTWLIVRKKYIAVLLSVLTLIYVNARGNPADIRPSDYQTAVYLILTLLNFFMILAAIPQEINEVKNHLTRSLLTFLGTATLILGIFGGMFLFSEFWRTVFSRYMGTYPLIYDRPAVAPMINAIVPPDHYCWVGPFEFEEIFYLKCKLPSKYHWILPQFNNVPQIKQEIISDYSSRLPDVIVYRRDYSAFSAGADFANFYVDFLNKNYVRVKDFKYHFVNPRQKDFNFDDDFNFEKSQASQVVAKLAELGIVQK